METLSCIVYPLEISHSVKNHKQSLKGGLVIFVAFSRVPPLGGDGSDCWLPSSVCEPCGVQHFA